MTLTADQENAVEMEVAQSAHRLEHEVNTQKRNIKLDCIRMAKEVLLENRRDQPSGSREVTSDDIIAFATAIEAHANS